MKPKSPFSADPAFPASDPFTVAPVYAGPPRQGLAPPPPFAGPGPGPKPAPKPPVAPVTTNPGLTGGTDNVITDPAVGFGHVISYSLDGTGNNLARPSQGAAGGDEVRLSPAYFKAGTVDTPVDGPNARAISNAIMANDPGTDDPGGRSAYMYAFGQFIDHDLDRNPSQTASATNQLSITVPADDKVFAPGSSITITRGKVDPANGLAVNAVTSYLDLSQVYGSDAATAASLRNADGTLKTSAGGNLPIVNGQFAGGDIRAAENPDLTSVDVLFVREHNYWVAKLHAQQPSLTGDQLYGMARAIATAEYQNVIYKEYLPALLGKNAMPAYKGYDPKVSAQIFQEFSTAAFRFGHTIISPTESKIANDGTVLESKGLIAAASEDPSELALNGGADALLRNMAADVSQQAGVHIIDDLLNLFSPTPGQSFDLGAVDVERERDLGIGTLNDVRAALGLPRYTSFSQLTSDTALAAKLQQVYGTVDKVDLFVGGMAEKPLSGSMLGQTFGTILVEQFANLRAGDRLFFENQGFTPQMLAQIEATTMSDLILRDTDTTIIQQDAFIAYDRHASNVASGHPDRPQLIIGVDTAGATISALDGVANTVVSGAGLHQVLVGGTGKDTFVFLGSGHQDTVTHFTVGADVLDFENLTAPTTFKDVVIGRARDGSAVVTVAGNTVTLTGVEPKRLSAASFQFNQDNPAVLALQPGQH
jgi:peroxidase